MRDEKKTSVIWTAPVLPGKSEGWRRFCQELLASRRQAYAVSRQRLGIQREAVWLVTTPQGELAVVYWEGSSLRRAWQEMLSSERPFDRWFRQQLEQFLALSEVQSLAQKRSERLYRWQSPDQ